MSAALLAACGGGGLDDSRLLKPDPLNPGGGSGGGSTPAPGSAQVCAPNNPYRTDVANHTVGTLSNEKNWVAQYMLDAYLWYKDIPAVNASDAAYSNENAVYSSLDAYFEALKTPLKTASGAKKDKFSFTYPTKKWEALFADGASFSYGAEWKFSSVNSTTQKVQIAYVEPGSPAAAAGLMRGDTLVSVDGVSATDKAVNTQLEALLYPTVASKHTFTYTRNGNPAQNADVTPGKVTSSPVLHKSTFTDGSDKVGYLVFNDHIATAEQQLIDTITNFKAQNVNTLILDVRYNGGGYLYIASELAYMIAGATTTSNKVFEKLQYNDKRPTDTANGVTPFYSESCILVNGNCTKTAALPTLNLNKVYVITSGSTCSASEAIINGLKGIDVTVEVIGGTTCGKPYGFVGKSNCGISYFPMEFQGVNHKGFGDYADGFPPTCSASDDLTKQLGDVTEGMLKAALYRKNNPGSCLPSSAALGLGNSELRRSIIRENKYWIQR
ncbi:S41 family peptidase [Chitinibacter sp. ZOR0017]|uniref:S41 family peptidase n=1 Tax=Chitinibacter sp. ZOR0017 TaxID=1339254 RepID=UPI00064656B8|nr:S41 family peptidase [Chitinibacter sp. ZOR0017]